MGALRIVTRPAEETKTQIGEAADRAGWDFLAITFRVTAAAGLWIAAVMNLRPATQASDLIVNPIQAAAGFVVFAVCLVGLAVLRKTH